MLTLSSLWMTRSSWLLVSDWIEWVLAVKDFFVTSDRVVVVVVLFMVDAGQYEEAWQAMVEGRYQSYRESEEERLAKRMRREEEDEEGEEELIGAGDGIVEEREEKDKGHILPSWGDGGDDDDDDDAIFPSFLRGEASF